MAGALFIELASMYPAAPATIDPTSRPTMMDAFLRKGEPKSSTRTIVMKERKPRPMYCGEPQVPGRRPVQSSGGTSVRPDRQFEPPPQFGIPDYDERGE